MDRKAYIQRQIKIEQLRDELYGLLLDCTDEGVEQYFNFESDRMLEKKIRVLKRLNNGEGPDDIGKEYFDILENLKVPEGQTVIISGIVLDPHKYD